MSAGIAPLRLGALTAGLLLLAPLPLFADMSKSQCVDANAKGQDLRREGKLSSAAEQLRSCSVSACPVIVREDCTRRLDEVVRAQPSIVFDVKDDAGGDVIVVRVSVDGQLLTDHLDGKPLKVDPGEHTFTLEVAGKPAETRRLLVKEGEAGRQERVVIGASRAVRGQIVAGPEPPPVETTPPAAPSAGLGTQRLIGLTLGGAGVVGLGLGVAFGILTSSAWSSAKTDCGGSTTRCTNVPLGNSDRSTAETDSTISTVGFIAGGALLAGGAVLFLTGGHPQEAPGPSVSLAPSLGPGQAGVSLHGVF